MEKIESIGLVLYNPTSLSNLALDKLMDKNKDLRIFIYLNSILETKIQIEIENLKNKYNNIITLELSGNILYKEKKYYADCKDSLEKITNYLKA